MDNPWWTIYPQWSYASFDWGFSTDSWSVSWWCWRVYLPCWESLWTRHSHTHTPHSRFVKLIFCLFFILLTLLSHCIYLFFFFKDANRRRKILVELLPFYFQYAVTLTHWDVILICVIRMALLLLQLQQPLRQNWYLLMFVNCSFLSDLLKNNQSHNFLCF